MSIYTNIFSKNHQQSVVSNLKNSENLPFSTLLSKEDIARYTQEMNCRERVFSPDKTLWAFLSQVMNDDQSQQAAVTRVIAAMVAEGKEPPSANTSAYSQARSRLTEEMLSGLTRDVAKQMEEKTEKEWLWRGRRVKLMDGSSISMPDTAENQAVYPQQAGQRKGIGFPIARIVLIIEHSTGVVLDLAIGPFSGKKTGEHALLRSLIDCFKPNDIAMGDCYYPSFFLMAELIQNGVDAVFPMHGARKHDFRKGKKLGKKDHIVDWIKPKKPEWMEQVDYEQYPSKISIREVAIENKQAGFRSKKRVLVTTFFDPKIVKKSDLASLYDYRWFVEIELKSIKDTMNMDILRGKTPGMVRKEIWAHLLAYNLVRKVMTQAARVHGKVPTQLSFKLALQVIKAFQNARILNEDNSDGYIQKRIFEAIIYKKVGNRSGREEPRAVKRRPKSYSLLMRARGFYKNTA